jgi:8-oxo-dGTP pyrophosphatase MutT (NUDIX family)
MVNSKYRKGFFAVVYTIDKKNNIKYLLFKRKLHWFGWEFLKGGIEKKEKTLMAVKRELFEETGLTYLKIKKYNKTGKYYYLKEYKDRPKIKGQTYSLYSIQVEKDRVKIDKTEHKTYKWLKFKRAIKKLTWEDQKKCLKIVNQDLEKTNKKR